MVALELPCQHASDCDYHGRATFHGCVCISLMTREIHLPFDNADSAVEILTELYRAGQLSRAEYDQSIEQVITHTDIAPCRVHRSIVS